METDIEPYEETINYYNCRTPVNSRTFSPATVAETPPSRPRPTDPYFLKELYCPRPLRSPTLRELS